MGSSEPEATWRRPLTRVLRAYRVRTRLSAVIDAVNDRLNGISTAPESHQPVMTAEFVGYYPLSYQAIRRIRAEAAPQPEDVLFDIGCGKGRALCLFAQTRMARCIGVELDEALAAVARRNAQTVRGRQSPIEVRIGNAVAQDYSQGSLFLMYNPFGPATLAQVLDRIKAGRAGNARGVRIIYAHPQHETVLAGAGWLHLQKRFPVPFQTTMTLEVAIWGS